MIFKIWTLSFSVLFATLKRFCLFDSLFLGIPACNSLRQSFVSFSILLDDSEDDEEVVLLRHAVDVGHAGVVLQLGVGVVAGPALRTVQVTFAVIGRKYSRQFAIAGKVIVSVCGQDYYLPRVLSPSYSISAYHHLEIRQITGLE